MSQYTVNTGFPPATAILDWTAVPDEAIQSASDDDQTVADAKFAERQRRKRVHREQRAAAEAAEHERREREEAEHREREEAERREREETERREREEAEHREREEAERRQREEVERRQRESVEIAREAAEGSQVATSRKGKEATRAETPVGPCARCLHAQVECTFELAKVSRWGKRSCDRCTGLKEQCKLPGGSKEVKAGTRGKRTLEDQTSPRAGEKKKRARAKSPEVEVVGGPSKAAAAESGDGGIVQALHAITEAIDRHTEEMREHQRLAKSQHETQHRFNNHLWELLQETEYRQVETDESEGDETSEGEPEGSESSDDEWENDVRGEGETDAEAEV
ncbi:hypothetical protein EDD15DRAFT_2197184 [Pisolithus albus]|nr:hypothetical protein EDD15DRAFT_2197184 [Pisolithus albus]